MSKQIITIVLVVIVLLAGLIFLSRPQRADSTKAIEPAVTGTLSASETAHDFGTISMAKGVVTKQFTITNGSDAPVEIKRMETSCMCTTAFLVNGTERTGPFGMPGHGGPTRPVSDVVKPGESRIIETIFDPAAHGPAGVGPIDRIVRITDAAGSVTDLKIKALVTP